MSKAKATIFDGWKNILTGLGIKSKDKRMSLDAEWTPMPRGDAETYYAADDISSKIVDMLPEEMIREGFDLKTDDKRFPNIDTDIKNALDEIGAMVKLEEGLRWGRMYGGAGSIIGVDDGLDPQEPVNLEGVRKVSFLNNLDRWELHRRSIQNDPTQKNFGFPQSYMVQPTLGGQSIVDVHCSRILRWQGAKLPRRLFIQNDYWDDSVLTRPLNAIRNFQQSHDAVASILQDFAQAVYKIKNLTEMIAMGKDELVEKRLALVDRTRSVVNAIVIEDGEDFDRKVTALTGVPEVLKMISQRLVMATDVPHTKLLGESPSGMGATGESEITDWYDYVARKQETDLKPQLTYLIKLILVSKEGPTKGIEPENWRVEFRPLKQQSQKEVVDTKKVQADIDKIYLDAGVLMPEEVTQSRFGGDEFSYETQIDKELREEPEELEPIEATLQEPPEGLLGGADNSNGADPSGRSDSGRVYRADVVEKRGRKWVVLAAGSGKVLGEHSSFKKAEEQLKAIEASKAQRDKGH